MIDRPSDGMELDELREEYDWMYEFQSRMAERITGDKDVHNLVDYVGKLEAENAKLRKLVSGLVYATHPADRARLIAEAAELMCELGVEVG